MKKNLFGAVAAGLALALAITSFGCESGSDDPVKYATDLGNPVTAGSKFTYKLAPTIYTALQNTTPAYDVDVTEKGLVDNTSAGNGYSYVKYINGVQNYNLTGNDTWGKANTSNPKEGDIINTQYETITLDSKTLTWAKNTVSTTYKVQKIERVAAARSTDKPAYVTIVYTGSETEDETIARLKDVVATKTAEKEVADVAVKVAQKTLDDAVDGLDAAARKNYDAATTDAAKDAIVGGTKATAVTTAKNAAKTAGDALTTATENYNGALYYKENARFVITKTETKDGATSTTVTYYQEKDSKPSKVVYTSTSTSGKATTYGGSYTISGRSYKEAEILLTSIDDGTTKYEFDDAADKYTVKGVFKDSTKISIDFPESYGKSPATSTTPGSTFSKKGRTLKISGGVLSSQRISVNTSAGNDTSAFFLGAIADTAKRAVDEAVGETSVVTTNKFLVSKSYTLAN